MYSYFWNLHRNEQNVERWMYTLNVYFKMALSIVIIYLFYCDLRPCLGCLSIGGLIVLGENSNTIISIWPTFLDMMFW